MDEKLNRHISKVQLPNEQVYNLVPEAVKNGEYVINSPVLSADTEFVITSQNQTITGQKNFELVPKVKVGHETLVPSGYKEVEYIESSGTQYIDTGYTTVTNRKFELDFKQNTILSGFPTVLGAMSGSSTYKVVFGYGSSGGKFYTQCGKDTLGYIVSGIPQDTARHKAVIRNTTSGQTLTVDGDVADGTYNIVTDTDTDLHLFLFARNKGSSVSNYTSARLYGYKYSDLNSVVIQHLIPCYRESDGEVGLYDVTNDRFLTNSGTGEFVKGPDVQPASYLNVLTEADVSTVAISGSYNDLSNTPTIPTRVGQLTNDKGYITSADLPTNHVTTNTDQTITSVKSFTQRPRLEVQRLPSTYTEVEYIQFDGNSWINTGMPVHMAYKYIISYQKDNITGYRMWGAFNQQAWNGGLNASLTYTSGDAFRWTTDGEQNDQVVLVNPYDTLQHTVIIDNGKAYADGEYKGISDGHDSSVVSNYNAFLGTINPGGTTPTTSLIGRIYRYEVYNESGVLVQQLIPCKLTNSPYTPGFYDLVSNTFIGKSGGGTITTGPAVVDSVFLVEADLAPVATSGDYTDLQNAPTIGDGTLTLTVNGTNYTFKANQTTNTSVAITLPSGAMNFVGVSTTDPAASGATVSGHTTWVKGDFVLYKRSGETAYEEYVNKDGGNQPSAWELIGDADSYALKTVSITGTGALSGGGTIESNRTITHNKVLGTAKGLDIYKVALDEYGHVTNAIKATFADFTNDRFVQYTSQNLSDTAKSTARSNIGAGTYSKPDSGIPDSDLAADYVTVDTEQNITSHKTFTERPGLAVERLPSGYTELESITFNATNGYVDTGVIIKSLDNYEAILDAAYNGNNPSFATFYGFMSSATGAIPRLGLHVYNSHYMIGVNSTASSTESYSTVRSVYRNYVVSGREYLIINGVTSISASPSGTDFSSNSLPIYVGARNNGGSTIVNYSGITVYSFIVRNNTESHYFVPCRRESDGVLGLYDLNASSSNFKASVGNNIAGPDVTDSDFLVEADLAPVALSGNYADLIGTPSLAAVATSGNYNDLINKPTIADTNQKVAIRVDNTTVNFGENDTVVFKGSGGTTLSVDNKTVTIDSPIIPPIPTVYNRTLNLQANGVTVDSGAICRGVDSDLTLNITADDLGLSAAMHFVGISSTDPTVSGATVSPAPSSWHAGYVVLYKRGSEANYEEYILTADSNVAANWELLGDADSYALKTVTVSGEKGIAGSGTLASNITLKANLVNETQSSSASTYAAGGASKFYAVQLDKNGKLAVAVPWDANTHYTNSFTIKGGNTPVTTFSQSADATTTFNAGTNLSITTGTNSITYNHSSVTRTNTTSSATVEAGGTFTAIDSITSNGTGHITAVNTKTVTVPAAPQIKRYI